jgi:hypothetical protein
MLLPEFIVAAYDDNRIAVLRFWDTTIMFTLGDVPMGALNHGLAWGAGDTVWGKSYQGVLYHIGLDFINGTASVLHTYTNLPSLAPIAFNAANQYLGAVSVGTPDALRLFSVANLAAEAVALDTESFVADNPWSPAAGAVAFGADRVYALNPNHGIVAMQLHPYLRLFRQNKWLTLEWSPTATLQSAPEVTGAYTDTGMTSPVTVDMSTNAHTYFRVR